MNWSVRSSVSGGQQYSTATKEEYEAIACGLETAGESMEHQGHQWSDAAAQVRQCQRLVTGACEPFPSAPGHDSLPYASLAAICDANAKDCATQGKRLRDLAGLLERAQSLYVEAENEARSKISKQMTIMLPIALIVQALRSGDSFLKGWAEEGGPNPVHLIDDDYWLQEGTLNSLAVILGFLVPTDANMVNRAATVINLISERWKNGAQGDKLTVTQIDPGREVMGEASSLADCMDNLVKLTSEIYYGSPDGAIEYGTIGIQQYLKEDGSKVWMVYIPGTDGTHDSPFGWSQNFQLMSALPSDRVRTDSVRAVLEAMDQAGIGRNDSVILAGHSQGGIVAATIAADCSDRYNIAQVVTAGSPVAGHPIPEDIPVLSIEIDDEIVAALDGASNPERDNWVTVRGESLPTPNTPSDMPYDSTPTGRETEDKEISHHPAYHNAALQNALGLGSPALQAHADQFAAAIGGTLVGTSFYKGRMSHPSMKGTLDKGLAGNNSINKGLAGDAPSAKGLAGSSPTTQGLLGQHPTNNKQAQR